MSKFLDRLKDGLVQDIPADHPENEDFARQPSGAAVAVPLLALIAFVVVAVAGLTGWGLWTLFTSYPA